MVYQCIKCKHFFPRVNADGLCSDCKKMLDSKPKIKVDNTEQLIELLNKTIDDVAVLSAKVAQLEIKVDTVKKTRSKR